VSPWGYAEDECSFQFEMNSYCRRTPMSQTRQPESVFLAAAWNTRAEAGNGPARRRVEPSPDLAEPAPLPPSCYACDDGAVASRTAGQNGRQALPKG